MRTLCFLVLGCAALPAFAAESPWDGSWKLNRDKSQITGRTYSVQKSGTMYAVDDGPVSWKYACDGKEYPIFESRTYACTESGTTAHYTVRIHGKVVSTGTDTLSPDNNTLTTVSNSTDENGTHTAATVVAERVGSGTGYVGTWKTREVKSNAPDTFTLHTEGDSLRWKGDTNLESFVAKLDGTPTPVTGPRMPPQVTASVHSDGANKLKITFYLKDKPVDFDELTLNEDGSLTDVNWAPGKESEKVTLLYQKQ